MSVETFSSQNLLSSDAIATIAGEARALPASSVGRHVFPLLQHITALEGRLGEVWAVGENHDLFEPVDTGPGVVAGRTIALFASQEEAETFAAVNSNYYVDGPLPVK